mgnify:CR=1 FL=1
MSIAVPVSWFPVLIVMPTLVPLIGAAITLVAGRIPRLQRVVTVLAITTSLSASLLMLFGVSQHGTQAIAIGGWDAGVGGQRSKRLGPLGITLVVDHLSAMMLVVSSTVLLAVILYAIGQGLRDEAVGDALIGAQMDLRLRLLLALGVEALRGLGAIHRLAVPEQHAGRIDRELDLLGPQVVDLRTRLRQLELDRLRQQRRGDDEDHQQHQHHVDQRDHVDVGDRRAAALRIEAGEGHAAAPLRRPAAGPSRRRCAPRRRRRPGARAARGWRA